MRKDSELFLKKMLEYRKKVGKDSFEVIYQDYKEIPSIQTAIFDILKDLIKNNCLTSQSKVTDLEGHISINLTLDGITYFDGAKTPVDTSSYFFNVFGGQVNFAKDNGTISAVQNNNKGNIDFQKNGIEFQNNKKQDYIKIWNNRLFLHRNNDERPITLKDAFIMPDYKMMRSSDKIAFFANDTLDEIIEKFARYYNENCTMLITGVPGMGKSSITSWIANRFKDDDRVIILRFRDWKKVELEKGLLFSICKTLNCDIGYLENKLLILDGFDEMKTLNMRDSVLHAFYNDNYDFKHFKCIITSRPTYIDSRSFSYVIQLESFSIDKIDTFYMRITGKPLDNKEKIEANLEVLGIPVILYMAIMSNINISENPSKPELYNRIFAEKGGLFDRFCNEGIGYGTGAQILRNPENIKKYLVFLQKVAFKMFESNCLSINIEDLEVPELEFQGDLVSILEFPIKHLFEGTENNIEFIHKSIYEYFVAEYIFSSMEKSKNKSKEELAGFFGDLLKSNVLSEEILEFMRFKINNSKLKNMFDAVYKVFLLMLRDGMTYYVKGHYKNIMKCEMCIFANMLELIHLWKNSYFNFNELLVRYLWLNRDYSLNLKNMIFSFGNKKISLSQNEYLGDVDLSGLSGIDLRSTDLEMVYLGMTNLRRVDLDRVDLRGANLEGANFEGANLEGACLTRANMKGANLKGANLADANLKEANLIEANLIDANLLEACLIEAELDDSYWLKSNVEEVLPLLQQAHFYCLNVYDDGNEKNYIEVNCSQVKIIFQLCK